MIAFILTLGKTRYGWTTILGASDHASIDIIMGFRVHEKIALGVNRVDSMLAKKGVCGSEMKCRHDLLGV